MCVVGRVRSPVEVAGHSTTKQQRPDSIVDGARLVLVECQDNEGFIVVEACVFKERDEPVVEPRGHEEDVGVVSIIDEVRGNENPLWYGGRNDIGCKVVEVTEEACSLRDVGNRIVEDERVVLPDIERVWRSGCVQVVCRCVARVYW